MAEIVETAVNEFDRLFAIAIRNDRHPEPMVERPEGIMRRIPAYAVEIRQRDFEPRTTLEILYLGDLCRLFYVCVAILLHAFIYPARRQVQAEVNKNIRSFIAVASAWRLALFHVGNRLE